MLLPATASAAATGPWRECRFSRGDSGSDRLQPRAHGLDVTVCPSAGPPCSPASPGTATPGRAGTRPPAEPAWCRGRRPAGLTSAACPHSCSRSAAWSRGSWRRGKPMTTHSESHGPPREGARGHGVGGPWHHHKGLASRKGSCYQGGSCWGCGWDRPAPACAAALLSSASSPPTLPVLRRGPQSCLTPRPGPPPSPQPGTSRVSEPSDLQKSFQATSCFLPALPGSLSHEMLGSF